MEAKLAKESVSEAEAAEILQMLLREGYVDDARYARAFVRDRSCLSGWGRDKIRFQLKGKGIAPELIAEAMECCDSPDSERRFERLIAVKWKSLAKEEDRKRREKTLRFALGRGYRYEEIKSMIDKIKDSAND